MDAVKPYIEQIRDTVKAPNIQDLREGVASRAETLDESLKGIKDGIKNTLSDFSKKSLVDANMDFLTSNSLLAKFSFIILVLILFMIVLKIIMVFLIYFVTPSKNPFIIQGSINGNESNTITQDPSKTTSIQILRSNDQNRGLEFTWSSWLFFSSPATNQGKNEHIFNKGTNVFNSTGVAVTNGPGLYVQSALHNANADITSITLLVYMDQINQQQISVSIADIPIKKWVHVAIRVQNKLLDIYVNGVIAKRHNFEVIPKQNFHDINVCGNGGFSGKLSNLRYYSYALNVFEINNIIMSGPSITPSAVSVDANGKLGNYSYLANTWYQ